MAKYTLDETWELCLQLWKWIAKKIKANPGLDVIALKSEWFEGFGRNDINENCFFCDYCEGCSQCPGKLVDPDFDCRDNEYFYIYHPIKFYEKLVELDKKRKDRP